MDGCHFPPLDFKPMRVKTMFVCLFFCIALILGPNILLGTEEKSFILNGIPSHTLARKSVVQNCYDPV